MSRGHRSQQGGGVSAPPPLQPVTDRASLRVELLRLAYRADLQAHEIVARAKAFEAYVDGDQAADKP